MQLTEHLCLMADYNQWMNTKVYDSATTLSAEELAKNRGAFLTSCIFPSGRHWTMLAAFLNPKHW